MRTLDEWRGGGGCHESKRTVSVGAWSGIFSSREEESYPCQRRGNQKIADQQRIHVALPATHGAFEV
jgi:hypothetical protein